MEYIESYIEFKPYKIYNRIYNSNSDTDNGILFLHNKNGHIGYLDLLLNDFSFKNYKIFAFDVPSRGRSSPLTSGHFDIYKKLPPFLELYISNLLKHKIKHLFIIGESVGALVAFYIYHNFKNINIDKLVFMPGIYNIKEFSNFITRIFIQIFNIINPKMIIKSKTSLDKYTESKKMQKILKNDNLIQFNSSICFIHGIYKYLEYMKRNIKDIDIPLLILQGNHDHYTKSDDLHYFVSKYLSNKNYLIREFENSKHWLLGSDSIDAIKKEIIEFFQ